MQNKTTLKVEQDYRIFFAFMTLVLAGAYILSFVQNSTLRQFWYAALFTGLMVIHILLHWSVISIVQTSKYRTSYVLGQGLLAFVITYLTHNTGMIFALYMALIGETIGFLGINRRGILATLYYLALSLLNVVLLTDFNSALRWLVTVIPIIIFIGMYVTLYLRQAEAREKAQQLATELEAANRQLSDYAARVEDLTILNERQRMARSHRCTPRQQPPG
jgi:NarL family two-component system sensor histidine kinase YdfH